jgi:hypothetical protein
LSLPHNAQHQPIGDFCIFVLGMFVFLILVAFILTALILVIEDILGKHQA